MMEDPALKAALAEHARGRWREQPHLKVEELETYHWGDLAPDRQEAVRDHLAVCPECVALLTALDGFPNALAADDGQAPGDDVEAALATTLARVRRQETGVSQSLGVGQGRQRRPGWWTTRAQGLAAAALAALLIIAIGSGLAARSLSRRAEALATQAARLESELARSGDVREKLALELERSRRELAAARERVAAFQDVAADRLRPHVNTPVELLRATRMRGAAEATGTVRLPVGADFLTLVLEDPQDQRFPGYRVELRGPRGQKLGEANGLERTPHRSFVVTLPRQILPAGRLAVRLIGIARGGAEREIAAYAVEIVS